jgi:hypothetical protein
MQCKHGIHYKAYYTIQSLITTITIVCRLGVNQRTEALHTALEYHRMDYPREGCTVTSIDVVSTPSMWKKSLSQAISEIRYL